jgi:hypothetical protein
MAESLLNQTVVSTNLNQTVQNGVTKQGFREFRWTVRNEPWNQDLAATTMRQLTAEVFFTAQGAQYSVRLSTLVDGSPPTTQSSFQQ